MSPVDLPLPAVAATRPRWPSSSLVHNTSSVNTVPLQQRKRKKKNAPVMPPILSAVACVKNTPLSFFHPLRVCRWARVVPSGRLKMYFAEPKVRRMVGPVSEERPVMVEECQFIPRRSGRGGAGEEEGE